MQAGLPTFTRRDILERDGWLCQLCMQPIPRDVPARSPVAATVDHIVPLARGGSHEPTNCQAAHRQCNTRKGTRLTMPKGAGPHFG